MPEEILGYSLVTFLIWLVGLIPMLPFYCNDWWPQKYSRFGEYDNEFGWLLAYPIIPFLLLKDLIIFLINKLKQTQMNLRILGKAMGYMFMPTLGVLLMLLVGFFDPWAMWEFIKSNSFWAILIRIILFLAEIILIAVMYSHFEEKEILENGEKYIKGKASKTFQGNNDFDDGAFGQNCRYDDNIEVYPTEDEFIKVIKLIKKA